MNPCRRSNLHSSARRGLAFTLLGVETHGKPLALEKAELPEAAVEAEAFAMRQQPG